MTDSEKVQIRRTCVTEAIKIKQMPQPNIKGYEDKDIVTIAQELELFVLGDSK